MIARFMIALFLVCSFMVSNGIAADVKERLSLRSAMETEEVRQLLGGDVEFYWGNQPHPPISRSFGKFKTSKRTTIGRRSRTDACAWALAGALIAFKERSDREGGNAVINLVSNVRNIEESSETEYTCLVGRMMVNVALEGQVVRLAK